MGCTGRYWRRNDGRLSFEVRLLNNGARPADFDVFTQQYRASTSQPWTTGGSTTWPLDRETSGFATPLFAGLSSPPFQWRARSCPRSPNDGTCSSWSNVINWIASSCAATNAGGTSPPVDRPVDAKFNDDFWKELIYNQSDRPGTLEGRVTRVWDTVPSIYVKTTDAQGNQAIPSALLDDMIGAIPGYMQEITRHAYTKRIETGTADTDRTGYVTFVFREEDQNTSCGRADIGPPSARVILVLQDRCVSARTRLLALVAHELGHAMGLYHVADTRSVMYMSNRDVTRFTDREQYHSQLAYDVGHGRRYCGWPYSESCQGQ